MLSPARQWFPLVAGIVAGGAVLTVLWLAVHLDQPQALREPYREAMSEANLRALANDQVVIAQGQNLFIRNCTLCHGTRGQGLVGPNLRDDAWLHGSDLARISENIANGNPQKGMAAWDMKPDDLHALTVFIASLQGSEDGSGKAPEGTVQPMTWRAPAP